MKSLSVKEWMANKVAQEVRANITMCEVFAVLKETEKAVYALLSIGANKRKCMWIPKSALEEHEVGEDANGMMHYQTLEIADYDEAVEAFTNHWAQFI